MNAALPITEGFIPFCGYRVWYRIVGDSEETSNKPLLCLHGGPGIPHDYLEPIGEMAGSGRRVIFYDQLGCGNSDHPHNPNMWTVELFLAEIDTIRRSLRLERVHILGQSWGCMLAMEYALTRPSGLTSLILSDPIADMHQWVDEANRLRAELPREVQQTLWKYERAGTTEDPAYQEAVLAYYRRHLCRLKEWPECLNRSFEKLKQSPEVYYTMNGPSEFHVIGTLRNWSIVDRLKEIHIPTLLLSGRYDEATPAIVETINRGIAGSEWVVFENSAHMPHLEEPNRYSQTLNDFLTRVDNKA
jgi:L-proline amide hydrolase